METLPVAEFRRLDLNAGELGHPVRKLMARAGKALADEVRAYAKGKPIVLLCGKGNNGGDGFAAAGLLQRWGLQFTVVLMEPRDTVRGPARAYLDLLPADKVKLWKGARRASWSTSLIVDCMLGSGIHGRPRPPYDAAIKWCNQQKAVLACDLPSGFGSPLAVKPTRTLTFHAAKDGMTKANSGSIKVAPIGIPRAAETDIGVGDLAAGFVAPQSDSHKGANGRLLVIGGGPFKGAPHYAGLAACRVGADLVHVATPAEAAAVIQTWGPDLMVHVAGQGAVLDDSALAAVEALMPRCDAVVIGPGLGTDPRVKAVVKDIVTAAGKRQLSMVLDADALDAIDQQLLDRYGRYMVLTPHGQEFQDLTGWKPVQANVTRYAKQAVTVLKGPNDIVSDGTRTRICRRGHPTMTVGGTGDALAGVTGALLAKGATPFDAACAATYLLGCAGEVAALLRGSGATTTDIIEALPSILKRVE